MIIELDTSLLEIIDNISINQLVFLSLVLDKNQKSHQGITPLIRLVSDSEIQDLIDRNLIQKKDDSKKLIYNHFHFYCGCSNIIMAIETEMFRLLFLCHERVNLMELYTREKELLIMFGSERRLEFSV